MVIVDADIRLPYVSPVTAATSDSEDRQKVNRRRRRRRRRSRLMSEFERGAHGSASRSCQPDVNSATYIKVELQDKK